MTNWQQTSPADQAHFSPQAVFAAGLKQHHLANTAYPIGHLTTMRPYRVAPNEAQSLATQAWQPVEQLGLYVHIPFCEQRCSYCEYCVVAPDEFSAGEDEYFRLLLREFEMYRAAIQSETKSLIGFDIGGGTPSAVKTKHIAEVIDAAQKCFQLPENVTISIETTPRIAANQPEKIKAYYQMGIRRISMGVQMVNPRLLEILGRPHTSLDYNRAAAKSIRAAGFERFNIDVMYGFAGQSVRGVEATLKHVIGLGPEYVTLYRMRYKGTRLARQAEYVTRQAAYDQYKFAKAFLCAAGYQATPGKNTFSRIANDPGTSDYLTRRVINGTPYLGLGLGAQSLSEITLAYNAGAAEKRLGYYQHRVDTGKLPIQDLYHLSMEAAMGKMISVAFYFGEINLPAFRQKFGRTLTEAFPNEIAFLLSEGLMDYSADGENLRLTEEGVENSNGVIALFYAPAVQGHLLQLAGEAAVSKIIPVCQHPQPTAALAA